MVNKKYWEKFINQYTELVNKVTDKKTVKILGKNFEILPQVFSPAYSTDTGWFAEKVVPITKSKDFLEIGAGAGAIVCLASMNGAAKVFATDINPNAVKNIRINAKRHAVKITVKEGNLYEPIPANTLFDLIFWNHPFYYVENELENPIDMSVSDTKYQYLKIFFQQGKYFLKENGRLLLGTSNVARLNLIKGMAKEKGYKIDLLEKVDVPVFQGKKTKMDLRLYSFQLSNR